MSAEQIESEKNGWVTGGIILAFFTVVAYLCAFFYEWGYLDVFGIPSYFVELAKEKIVITFIMLGAIILSCTVIFLPCRVPFRKLSRSCKKILLILVSSVVVLVVLVVLVMTKTRCFYTGFVIVALLSVGLVLLVIKPKKIIDLFNAKVISKIGVTEASLVCIYKGLAWILLLIIVAFTVGRFVAAVKRQFLVLEGSPQRVVLQRYKDNLICAPFCRETKEVKMDFQLIKIGDKSESSLKNEIVGPLKPVREGSPL